MDRTLSNISLKKRTASVELRMSISVAYTCALDINLDANTFSLNYVKAILLVADFEHTPGLSPIAFHLAACRKQEGHFGALSC